MSWLPKRRWSCLVALVLFSLLAGSALVCFKESRITRADFERIQNGMTEGEVCAMLSPQMYPPNVFFGAGEFFWSEGRSWIKVTFDDDGKVCSRAIHIATGWETMQWNAEQILRKVGMRTTDNYSHKVTPVPSMVIPVPSNPPVPESGREPQPCDGQGWG